MPQFLNNRTEGGGSVGLHGILSLGCAIRRGPGIARNAVTNLFGNVRGIWPECGQSIKRESTGGSVGKLAG